MAEAQARGRSLEAPLHRDRARGRFPLRSAGRGEAVSLRATLLLALAYVLLLALIALGVPLAISLRDRVDSEVRSQARSQADVVAATAPELLGPGRRGSLERLVHLSGDTVRGRVIVVGRRGALVADSASGAPLGTDYSKRPEVAAALSGRSEQIQRRSETLGAEILATAVPIVKGGRPAGAVRITQSVAAVHRAVKTSILDLALLAAVVLVLGMAVGALIAQQIARPIRKLDDAARAVAGGDLDASVAVEGSSEQRSLARTFNEMTARVKRLLRSQQDFVADASHQLRTPLTGLRLRLEGLREEVGPGDPAAAELDAGMREIDRLSGMVDELLILSRAGERELPGKPMDLGEAADRARERWRKTAAERRIALSCERDGTPGRPLCTRGDLDRAIDALLENAITYSPAGSEVRVVAGPDRIEVLDRGPGLAEGEQEAVFERFRRGSAGRKVSGGSGLGLAIARELSREWGGDVSLANRAGGGLRASVRLGVAPEESP
ncbi:MAG: HAMP domain-containing sensor histidine kinase [Solirubrobacterales bacterium]